MRENYWLGER